MFSPESNAAAALSSNGRFIAIATHDGTLVSYDSERDVGVHILFPAQLAKLTQKRAPLLSWLMGRSRLWWLTLLLLVVLFSLAAVYRDRYPIAQLLEWPEGYPTDDVVWHPEESPVQLPTPTEITRSKQ